MKFLRNLTSYAPMLAAVLVIACVANSLSGYVVPAYGVEQPEREKKEATATDEPQQMKETEPEETVTGSFDKEDGVYQGTGTGFRGEITVSVTIKNRQIVSIDIVRTSDDETFFNRAKAVIHSILEKQSLDVDVVSGATFSSRGIINAVKNALTGKSDSQEPASAATQSTGIGSVTVSKVEEPSSYKDGTYYGTGTGFGGPLQVQVTISGGNISSISLIKSSDDSSYIQKASALFKTIIAAQSTNVDVVSGATYSSAGIIEAVRNALSQAVGDSAQKSQNSDQQGESDEDTERITGTVPFIDGIFYGTGEGYRGDIEVAVVIKDKTINTILITKQEDDKKFMDRAKEVAERVVQTQSTKVDVISGATYSSKGILQAIKNALGEAKKATLGETEVQPEPTPEVTITPEMTPIPGPEETGLIYLDGEYQAAVLCVPDENEDFEPYQLSLTITVKNDNIVAITDVAGDGDPDNESYIDRALNGTSKYKGVVAQILEKGKLEEIDTVSRATCSSKSIIEACRQALNNAKRTEKTES